MAKLVLPRVRAMVLCDALEESNQENDVFHLKGVRSQIQAAGFPYTRPRLCVYLQLSGHAGQAACHIEISQADTDEMLYRASPRLLAFEGPLFVVSAVFRFRNCGFPAPGIYYIQAFNESKLIGERSLLLSRET